MAMFPGSGAFEIDQFPGKFPGRTEFFGSAVNINITCQYYYSIA